MFENPINIYKKPEKKSEEIRVRLEYLGKKTLTRAMAVVTFLAATMAAEMPASAAEIKVEGVQAGKVDKDFFNLDKTRENSSESPANFTVETDVIQGSKAYNDRALKNVSTKNLNPELSIKKNPNNFIEESGGSRKSILIGEQR